VGVGDGVRDGVTLGVALGVTAGVPPSSNIDAMTRPAPPSTRIAKTRIVTTRPRPVVIFCQKVFGSSGATGGGATGGGPATAVGAAPTAPAAAPAAAPAPTAPIRVVRSDPSGTWP